MSGRIRLFLPLEPIPGGLCARRGVLAAIGVLVIGVASAGCSESAPEPEADAEARPEAPEDISGRYDVSGITTTPGTDHRRKISGTIVLSREGDAYTASYELETLFPGEQKPIAAHVIGVGEGRI
jgi:hypothetical protein